MNKPKLWAEQPSRYFHSDRNSRRESYILDESVVLIFNMLKYSCGIFTYSQLPRRKLILNTDRKYKFQIFQQTGGHRSLWDIGTFPSYNNWNKIKTQIKLKPRKHQPCLWNNKCRSIKNALARSGRQVARKPKGHRLIPKRGNSRKREIKVILNYRQSKIKTKKIT